MRRRYSVTVEGFGAEIFHAATSCGAKAMAFRALRDAGGRLTFRDFLSRVSVLALGPTVH